MPRKNSLTHVELARRPGGKRVEGAFFSFSVAKLSSGPSKCACVVSKKVAPKAHDRNLIKRRCREVTRPLLLNLRSPVALVVHARKQALGAPFASIREDINKLIQSCQ